ncbi:MAG: response regulator [Burkholderiaceae bacterium]
MKLCLVEDDLLLGRALKASLEDVGHEVLWLRLARDAEQRLATTRFDAALLDLGLPDSNGLDLLRNIRRAGNSIPVVIITARESLAERIDGLEAGADDFLIKPFANVELLARLRAVLRRGRNLGVVNESGGESPESDTLKVGGLVLFFGRMQVQRDGQSVSLSPTEFGLLAALMRNRNRIRTRRQLEEDAMPDSDGDSLDVHISNLRRKVGRDAIRTVRGVGYVIEETGADGSGSG